MGLCRVASPQTAGPQQPNHGQAGPMLATGGSCSKAAESARPPHSSRSLPTCGSCSSSTVPIHGQITLLILRQGPA